MGFEPTTFGTTIRHSNQLSYIHRVIRFSESDANIRGFAVLSKQKCEKDYKNRSAGISKRISWRDDGWKDDCCAEQGSAEDFGKEYKKGEDGLPSPP